MEFISTTRLRQAEQYILVAADEPGGPGPVTGGYTTIEAARADAQLMLSATQGQLYIGIYRLVEFAEPLAPERIRDVRIDSTPPPEGTTRTR